MVNRKRIYAILKSNKWMVHQRPSTPSPRVQGSVSRTALSNPFYAMDMTHMASRSDGWAHLVAAIDCHDRELIGWEFAISGRAKREERAIEEACIRRFGTLRPTGRAPVSFRSLINSSL
jgi:putative transposase